MFPINVPGPFIALHTVSKSALAILVLTAQLESQRIDVTLYSQDAAAGCFPGQYGYEPQSPSPERRT
jgi:hypothetical protein